MNVVATTPRTDPAVARAELRRSGDTLTAVLTGTWSLDSAAPRFTPLIDAAAANGKGPGAADPEGPAAADAEAPGAADAEGPAAARGVVFDTTALGEWDSSLLVYLQQAHDYFDARDVAVDTSGLPDRLARLLALARAVPERVAEEPPPKVSIVTRGGLGAISAWDASVAAVTFTGQVTDGFIRLLLGRARLRWRDFWVVVQSNSTGALPIVTLIAALIGVIIAFLGVVVLRRFGAGYYVSFLVGYGILREMGALMTGIIIAGRTGAAFAAELGTMKITEEIDAYTTLGISPVDHLVLPRMLGLFVMMPLLVIYANFIAIGSGMVIAVWLLDLTPTQFLGGMLSVVTLSDAALGVFKGGVFGLIVGLAGCMKGLQTGDDAGAVGRSATSAVVLGITLIIVANAVIDWLAVVLQI
jgi:phospholipid/cholesterol/gamma-HCH transport system permease protein